MTDPIVEALDEFVPAFASIEGDWPAILEAAAQPAAVAPAPQISLTPGNTWRQAMLARRSVRVGIGLALLAVVTTGFAWATGVFKSPTPHVLFATYCPAQSGSRPVCAGPVIAGSVRQIASVEIPKVGPVALWHADTKTGGFCLGLRLSSGSWLGTPPQDGGSRLDGGGTIPGCFPTGVIDPGSDHLEWLANFVDGRLVGGVYWDILSGDITAPGAVKVTDLVSGKSTKVIDGDVFVIAIQDNPMHFRRVHLVAYDKAGKVVASDRHFSRR